MISRREVVTASVPGALGATAGTAEAAQMQAEVQALKEGCKQFEDKMQELKQSLERRYAATR